MGQLGDLSPAASVAVGVIVGLLSTSIQSLGLTLQRKSHLLEDEKEEERVRRPPYRRRRWQLGMFMFVVANLVGSTIQITTLPLPVLSTLQASGLVFNTICATLILGEPFTRWSLWGTLLVAGGAILIALFGAIPEPSHNLNQLLQLLGRTQFILWMFGTAAIIVVIGIVAWTFTRLKSSNALRIRLFRGMCFGGISSILSAHSLLVAKSAVELLVRTIIDGVNQFNRWQSWMILLILIFFALTQLYFLHRGLKLCSTSVLYPFVFCVYNIIAILDGLIYFDQTDRLPPLHAGLIGVGTAVLLSGVLSLSWRLEESDDKPQPEPHSLLSPGMGLIEGATLREEDEDDSTSNGSIHDEEANPDNDENTPLLLHKRRTTFASRNIDDRVSHASKSWLRTTDLNEIWDELQDSPIETNSGGDSSTGPRRAVTLAFDSPWNSHRPPGRRPSPTGPRPSRHPLPRMRTTITFRESRRHQRPGRRSVSTPLPNHPRRASEGQESTGVGPLGWLGLGWWAPGQAPEESSPRGPAGEHSDNLDPE